MTATMRFCITTERLRRAERILRGNGSAFRELGHEWTSAAGGIAEGNGRRTVSGVRSVLPGVAYERRRWRCNVAEYRKPAQIRRSARIFCTNVTPV